MVRGRLGVLPALLQYDALNRVTNRVDALGSARYGFTSFGAVQSEDGPWASDTVSYTYSNHQRSGLSLEQPNTSPWTQAYGYDAIRRLTNLTSSAGVFGYGSHAGLGGFSSVTVATNGGTAVTATRYADWTFARTNAALSNGVNSIRAVATDSSSRGHTNTVSLNLPIAVTVLYDGNGNLRTNGTRVLDYDDENQLIWITEPDTWKSEFVYDGKMRRRLRREYVWQNSAWVQASETRYIYDGNLVVQERDEFNVPRVTYTRGDDLSGTREGAGGIGGLLARTDNVLRSLGDPRPSVYYTGDGNGNITCLLNTNQQVVGRYIYDPYGNTLAAIGPAADANLYRFSSKELHAASGLVYYLYRFYDPQLQRWPNRDPITDIGMLAGVHLALSSASPVPLAIPRWEVVEGANLYEFCHNVPLGFTDVDGGGAMDTTRGALGQAWWFVKDNWGKLGTVVGTACAVVPINNCLKLLGTFQDGVASYNSMVDKVDQKYGADVPPQISQLLIQWRTDLLNQLKQVSKACIGAVPGSSFSGPVDNPIKM